MKKLNKGILTDEQIIELIKRGYLSEKGKKVAKDSLAGKYDKYRYTEKKKRRKKNECKSI